MYKSPIQIYTDRIIEPTKSKFDEQCMKAVVNVGIDVDKDELIKALKYDRNQYEKGYQDCTEEHVKVLEKALDIAIDKYTCGYPNMRDKVKNEIMNIAKREVQE